MKTTALGKGCWECRREDILCLLLSKETYFGTGRRVSCDRTVPSCSNCLRANKTCQYGLRLSWPKEGDKRRSQVSNSSVRWRVPALDDHLGRFILNIEDCDMQLYFSEFGYQASLDPEMLNITKRDWYTSRYNYPRLGIIPRPMSGIAPNLYHDNHLVTYCMATKLSQLQ